ncbi:MAG TPA: hypothetical protein VK177_02030 [Flavobacteriales bacterium]|nr:hypothetical protein [Flavobacteriales bacterium]
MMPNKEYSIVEPQKIVSYLLNPDHEIGGPKSQFFFKFGFDREQPEIFERALKVHAFERDVFNTQPGLHGTKYKLVCEIVTPDARNPCIVTVWIINTGSETPKLVTAYPNK